MVSNVFTSILYDTIRQKLFVYCLFFVFALILLIAGIYGLRRRTSETKRIGSMLLSAFIIIAYLLFVAVPNLMAIQNDINNNQVVSVQGYYNFDATSISKKSLFGRVYISTGEESFSLELPANWNEQMFPRGKYYGKILYSEESKIIVCFLPDILEELT